MGAVVPGVEGFNLGSSSGQYGYNLAFGVGGVRAAVAAVRARWTEPSPD
jgi:hypothetical protein